MRHTYGDEEGAAGYRGLPRRKVTVEGIILRVINCMDSNWGKGKDETLRVRENLVEGE